MTSPTHKTYSLAQPTATHTRKASCEEVNCAHFLDGWTYDTRHLDERLWRAIQQSGKRFRREVLLGVEYLVFYPGQQCFAEHRVPNDREPFYLLTHHARRMNLRTATKFTPDNWVNDFAEHQEIIKKERGH